MADYFTQFTIGVHATPEEAALVQAVFGHIADRDERPCPPAFEQLVADEDPWSVPNIHYRDGVLYIDDDGNGEPWFLARVLAIAMPTTAIDIPYANTCSKPRLDAFGGGTWYVRNGEVFSAVDVLRNLREAIEEGAPVQMHRALEQAAMIL